jgi:alanine-glyoxylate transaminase/serine-glyoxylate transaminase/serine-pyruvate transaminase
MVYSGSQKCLSCPPGLAPVTVSERAAKVIRDRKSPVQSWYLDLSMIQRYWTQERFYHHTAPVNMIYALHEALRVIVEEGLEACWQRHLANSDALCAGLEAMGLEILASAANRLPSLISVRAPEGIDEASVRRTLLTDFNIEIGGGLGELKGRIWRIGLMGHGSRRRNVLLLLAALEAALRKHGWR